MLAEHPGTTDALAAVADQVAPRRRFPPGHRIASTPAGGHFDGRVNGRRLEYTVPEINV